jgi:S1-C subfamily serine protease
MTQAGEVSNPSSLPAFSEALASTVERVGRSVVAVRGRGRHALGCGIVWRDGILVAAAHVFGRAPATVSIVSERPSDADLTLIGTDAPTDLAVFRLPDSRLRAPDMVQSDQVGAGHLAILVGRAQSGEAAASLSIIHRASGAWQTWLGGRIDRLIRLDSGIHDGLSGAAVADATGAVFGMATSALSRSGGTVVPESTISRVVDELLSKGHVARAFLGISVQAVSVSAPPAGHGDADSGLLITSLLPGGPAAQAGLMVGDIVIDVADRRAVSLPDLRETMARNIGKRVGVSLIRGGQPAKVDVTIGQWPAQARAC